jgi:hypothetical protein
MAPLPPPAHSPVPPPALTSPDATLALESVILPAWLAAGQVLTLRGLVVLEITVRCAGGREAVFRFGDAPAPDAGGHGHAPVGRRPMARAILQALSDHGPLSPKEAAAKCDYEYSGTFRECVKGLVDAGDVTRHPETGKLDLPGE